MKTKNNIKNGFSLIELLVVMAIMAVAIGVSMFGLRNSRLQSRDNKRKIDLEQIRSALEIYRADCGKYPLTLTPGGSLAGSPPPASCLASNIYMTTVPIDPLTDRNFSYIGNVNGTYTLCAALEGGGTGSVVGCGLCGVSVACNYKLINP